MGFLDVAVNKSFIFLLHSGRRKDKYGYKSKQSNEILVYNWHGNPVAKINLDQEIRLIEISIDSECIIAAPSYESRNLIQIKFPEDFL